MLQIKGGDGLSKEQAIIILGVDAEYDYLESKYTEFEMEIQTLIDDGDKQYDILNIKLPDGIKKEIWFDISDFYGRE